MYVASTHPQVLLCCANLPNNTVVYQSETVNWSAGVSFYFLLQVGVVRREGGDFAHFSWAELRHYESGADYAPLQFDRCARDAITAVPEGPVDRNIEWVKWDHDRSEKPSELLGPPPPAQQILHAACNGGEGGVGLPWVIELAQRIGWATGRCVRAKC